MNLLYKYPNNKKFFSRQLKQLKPIVEENNNYYSHTK
jgi:hypothetical protein